MWSVLFVFQFRPSGYDAVFLSILMLVTTSMIYSCKRTVDPEAIDRHVGRFASFRLYLALLVLAAGLLSSFSAVSNQKSLMAWKSLDRYVAALFPQDAACRQAVSEY